MIPLLAGTVARVLVAISPIAAAFDPQTLPADTQKALESAPSFADSLTRMMWTLAITVIVLLAIARLLPRWMGIAQRTKSRGLIKIIESRALEPRKSLYLVQVVDQYYLLGSSDQRIEVLAGGDFEPATLERLAREAESTAGGGAPAGVPKFSRFMDTLVAKRPTASSAADADSAAGREP